MAAKKKSPWPAIGIGCGVVVVIGLIVVALLVGWCKRKVDEVAKDFEENPAKAAATMVVRMNPELEMVSTDDEAGTITVREKKTGKETTVNFEDAKDGKFTIESEGTTATLDGREGTMVTEGPDGESSFNVGGLEKLPEWFEVPAGVTGWRSLTHAEKSGKVNGVLNGTTELPADDLFAAFETNLEAAGFERVSKTETEAVLIGNFRNKAENRTISLSIQAGADAKRVGITYVER